MEFIGNTSYFIILIINLSTYKNKNRGFAFAEFSSAEEAKNAFTALENTHLYGRKLAIEWAKMD